MWNSEFLSTSVISMVTSLTREGKAKTVFLACTICSMHLALLTSVATADQVRQVGESFIAVVALAAAEEHLRVFLHRDTLLPKSEE